MLAFLIGYNKYYLHTVAKEKRLQGKKNLNNQTKILENENYEDACDFIISDYFIILMQKLCESLFTTKILFSMGCIKYVEYESYDSKFFMVK